MKDSPKPMINPQDFERQMRGAFDRLSDKEAEAVNLLIAGYQIKAMNIEELQDLLAHISDRLILNALAK